jgi:hypothetical protein
MSQQLDFLKNLLASVQSGNEDAVTLLRQICATAAEQAPVYDLLALGRCLYHLGVEASRITTNRH